MNGRAENRPADFRTEIAIVGGGLSGGLIALALRKSHPEMQVTLIEAGEKLGGNHRWSWFESDLDTEGTQLLAPFRKSEWEGYEVHFPAYRRKLGTNYRSLASADFDAALRRELGPHSILAARPVASLDARGVTLENGQRISARMVIDCRGPQPSEHLTGGWQVFMGRVTITDKPHGVTRPMIMDAALEQLAPASSDNMRGNTRSRGAYRFAYVLPLGANELFVEDTYYADQPVLDRNALSGRLDAYHRQHGWDGLISGGETGILPVITGGDFAAFQAGQKTGGVVVAGARGGFTHPLTSYSLPFAVETALAIAREAELSAEQMAALIEARARKHWHRTKFYRRLGAMLLGAALPQERYRVFEHFYRLPQDVIERFYAGNSILADKARILMGRPPVPIFAALRALAGKGSILTAREDAIG